MGIKVVSINNGTIRLDTTRLDSLQKFLKKQFIAKVGVLGGAPAREEGVLTNADLGAIHEYGTNDGRIPARSWLRMPLTFYMPKVYASVGQQLLNAVTPSNVVDTFKGLGNRAEAIIQRAFDTRGFGNWIRNAPITIHGGWMRSKTGKPFFVKGKKSDMPLIDTAEFRKSITSTVVTK